MAKPSIRCAYQVVVDEGRDTRQVGYKSRLVSFRRAHRIVRWLLARGIQARARCCGMIYVNANQKKLFN